MLLGVHPRSVIPAEAGIHFQFSQWMPASAGMTISNDRNFSNNIFLRPFSMD